MIFRRIGIRDLKATPEFARLHAHICADGYLKETCCRRSKKDLLKHPRKNIFRKDCSIRYVNTEKKLVGQFIKDIKKVFCRKVTKLRRNEYEVTAKWIYDIFKETGALKSNNWFIPSNITKSDKAVKKQWLRAFFDDEAYVTKKYKRIVLNIVNKEGLNQIQKLLAEFGINSVLNGPYRYKKYHSYHLTVCRDSIKKYFELIGFSHPKKKKVLSELASQM
ncbi:hypothetical protein KY347_01095 [Candidatus Woesearchaeota archaeon]|nr:hypothetical protein [Candidatus Woesearchaeota archaeon]